MNAIVKFLEKVTGLPLSRAAARRAASRRTNERIDRAALPPGQVPEASAGYALSELDRVMAEHDAARVEAQRTGQPLVWP